MPRQPHTAEELAFGLHLGAQLARARKELGLTGEEVARRVNISVDTVRKIEQGRIASPGLYVAAGLTKELELSLDRLVDRALAAARKRGAALDEHNH